MSWRCGQKAGQDYYVCLHMTHGNERAWAMVLTTKGKIQTDIKRAGSRFHQLQYHNYYNMFEFAKMIETGVMPQTHEFIMEKTTTFLTGFYSHMEKNGALVNCADLPEDWRSPETDPDRIPDEVFQ